jgi:hypothetical protein
MGQKNAKPPRILETYTSFDVLPTEYFNRRALQSQLEAQQQQNYTNQLYAQQPVQQYVIQPPQYSSVPLQQQQFYTPIQQQARPYQIYGQAPLIQEFGLKQPDSINIGSDNTRGYDQYRQQQRIMSSVNIYGDRRSNKSKNRLGLAPSSSQQIQSVPKFNRFVNNY